MIIPDINVLLYAINKDAPMHDQSRRWLNGVFNGSIPVGLPWIVILGFIRIITNTKIFKSPISMDLAVGIVSDWLSLENVEIINPGVRFWLIYRELLKTSAMNSNSTSDIFLAALALETKSILFSYDTDFAKIEALDWKIPPKLTEP